MKVETVFQRRELKFLLNDKQKDALLSEIANEFIPDSHGECTIYSLYYDTPDYLLARRSIEKPLFKEKLRVRSYGRASSDSTIYFELKRKCKSVTTKRRVPVNSKKPLSNAEEQIKKEITFALSRYEGIAPRVLINYDRQAYFHRDDSDFRITFDRNVTFRTHKLNLDEEAGGDRLIPEGMNIMEVKIQGAIPLWFTRILSKYEIYQSSFSKYGNAYKRIASDFVFTHAPIEVFQNNAVTI